MADIQRYLDDILEAVYGEEVRGSIHDAIEIINDVSEVVLSVGTDVTGPNSSSTGYFEDSFYLNSSTWELWKCIGVDAWQSQGVLRGDDGVGIQSITRVSSLGLVDNYLITFTDGTTQGYTVTNGRGIANVQKTATVGVVDTYTITYNDGSTETFDVTNGVDGVDGIDGSVWYKGIAINGTGSGIIGFPGKVNDYYLNSSNGRVFICVKTGGATLPDAAEWEYIMTLTGGGSSSITVVDNLGSSSPDDALSANQGRVLKGMVDSKVPLPSAIIKDQLIITREDPSDPSRIVWRAINVADLAQDSYNELSEEPISGKGVKDAFENNLDEYTSEQSPVSGVVTFLNLNPDYGYSIEAVIPDEAISTLPTSFSEIKVPTYTKVERSTNADGTINLKYTVVDNSGISGLKYTLRIKK